MNFSTEKEYAIDPSNPVDGSIAWNTADVDESSALALKNIYFFLGLLFRYPDETVYFEIHRHMEAFCGFFSEYGGDIPFLPPNSDLQAEYVSLFVNNKGFVPAMPYASPHMDKGLLMGGTYFRIKHLLYESGLSLKPSVAELEDHLAILLESCAHLVQSLIEGSVDVEKNRVMFFTLREITSCIENWIDDFEDKIHSYASFEFYKASAKALKNFIRDADNVFEQALGLHQGNYQIMGTDQ
jgi:TorA maturation chaperone TorD